MAQELPVFPSITVQESAVDTRWKKWCACLENLLVGLDIKDDKRKRALLLLDFSLSVKAATLIFMSGCG